MIPAGFQIDLVVLVPDKQMEATIRPLLKRHASLNIRPLTFESLVHPRRDPGCRGDPEPLLSLYLSRAQYALVLFDREGCGEEHLTRETLEANVEATLTNAGWSDRSSAIVIDPELESWVWSDSVVVDQTIGWAGTQPPLRAWLKQRGFVVEGQMKPERPKEAMEAAMKHKRKRRSASIYQELAEKVSLARCVDPAFLKFRAVLAQWFAA